ncbi:MAG: hypothetical protein M1326_01920 [Cyanobacteria bacterium]|nr:hypothetical protein [Cyanobacteriota bacterium]
MPRYLKIFFCSIIILTNTKLGAHQLKYPREITIYFTAKKVYFNMTYQIEQGIKAQNLKTIFDENQDKALSLKEQQKLINYLFRISTEGLQLLFNDKKVKIKKDNLNISNISLSLPNDLQLNLNYTTVIKFKPLKNKTIIFSLNKSFADEQLPLHLQKYKNIKVLCGIQEKSKYIKKIVFAENLYATVLLPENKLICKYQ